MESPKKNYFRRNKLNIITLIILLVFLIFGYITGCININYAFNNSIHLNMLTINSVLAGFIFTALGIMSSSIDRPRIDRLNRGGYLDDYFNGMYISIISHMVSIVATIFIIMQVLYKYKILFIYIQQIGLLVGVAFFIKSILRLFKIIKKIRQD